jgi:Ca2+-transporting ATPase
MSFPKKRGPEQTNSSLLHQRGSGTRERPAAYNPFAFTPKDLTKLHDPKDLSALRALGGVRGLLLGLRSNAKEGLSSEEYVLGGKVTLEDVLSTAEVEGPGSGAEKTMALQPEMSRSLRSRNENFGEAGSASIQHASTLRRISTMSLPSHTPQPFQDRKRIFSTNRIPQRRSKNLFLLMWLILQDRVLVLPRASFLI